jgi:hypothetical protein
LDSDCCGPHHGFTDDVVGVNGNQEMEMSESELCTSLQNCQKLKTVRWTGTWRLAPQRAMSLLPRKNSQLLIVQGCAWITWNPSVTPWAVGNGDHFLEAGQTIDVPAGARLVMEARHAHEAVQFDWREMPPGLVPIAVLKISLSELSWQWWQAWRHLGAVTIRLVRGLWQPGRSKGSHRMGQTIGQPICPTL